MDIYGNTKKINMENLQIQLFDIYQTPSDEDIQSGKNFVLRRESASNILASLIDSMLADAAANITQIAYRYGVKPTEFQISTIYNPSMFAEISQVLDEIEDEILDLTESYSMKCTKDEKKKLWLLPWLLALGRGNKGLRQTLEDRLWIFSRDLEAMIAAAANAKMNQTKAVSLIRSNIHTAYNMPGMQSAFAQASLFKAKYIRTRGVKKGNRGNSNSEANNILRFAKSTVQMAWMHYHHKLYEEQGAAGYMCFRGSTFPCLECDSICGVFHPIEEGMVLPVHSSCCCFSVPVFLQEEYSNK